MRTRRPDRPPAPLAGHAVGSATAPAVLRAVAWMLAATAWLGAAGCADDFSLQDVELAPGVHLVKPDGWILTAHPESGYELLRTRSARVRKIGVHSFSRDEIAAAAEQEDPAADAFATAVIDRYRERVRTAMAKRRGFPAALVGYYDAYGERRCFPLTDGGHTWQVCLLVRSDGGHPAWYSLYTVHLERVILLVAFAARDAADREDLDEDELRALLAPVRWDRPEG